MATFKVEIEGLEKLQQKLRSLDKKVATSIVKRGLRSGCKVVHRKLVELTPKDTGEAAQNAKVRAGKADRGAVAMIVGWGERFYTGDQFYISFLNFGYHAGSRKLKRVTKAKVKIGVSKRGHDKTRVKNVESVDNRRWIEGKHFVERAFEATKQEAANTAMAVIEEGIEQATRELGAKK